MSLQVTFPRGKSEPVALPISGGFSTSPVPNPVRVYVTLIVAALVVVAAQKLRAKTQIAADRRFLEVTLHILSFSVSAPSKLKQASRSKKLVVKPLLTVKLICLRRIGKTSKPVYRGGRLDS